MRRFAFRLCLALGGMTVAELLSRISSAELTEWIAFDRLEPFGGFQDEYRTGLVAAMVANTARDEKKKPRPFEPSDFMREPFLGEPTSEDERLMKKAQAIMGMFGAPPIQAADSED